VALAGGWWRGRGHLSAHDEAHARAPQADGALRLREAALVAAILSAVTLLVGWMQQQHGTGGLLAGIALGALADAQSGMAALGSMQVAGRITTNEVVAAVLVAVATNSTVRSATAFAAGGPRFGRTVLLSLLASTTAAASVAWALA